MSNWVAVEVIEHAKGLSRHQLRGMVRRGLLTPGVHVAVIDRKTLYDLEALEEWLVTRASEQRGQESRSDGRSGAGDTASTSTPRRPTRPYRMQLDSDAA